MKRLIISFALCVVFLAPALAVLAQDAAFPLPAPLYILTSEGVVLAVDPETGGQTQISSDQQIVSDFSISPDGAWYAYRTEVNNAVIVSRIDGLGGFVLEFDVPPAPVLGRGKTITWTHDAAKLAYIVPDGVRIAQLGREELGDDAFRTIIGGPWVDVAWEFRSTSALIVWDEAGQQTRIAQGTDGRWQIDTLAGEPDVAQETVPARLELDGVVLDSGTVVPATAGALAFDWGPVPPPLVDGTLLPQALTYLAADEAGVAQVWRLPPDGSPAHIVTAETAPVIAYDVSAATGQIAVATANSLAVTSLDTPGSDRRELALLESESGGASLAWSPDASQIAYHDRRGLWTVLADGSQPPRLLLQNVLEEGDVARIRSYFDPRWSDDGARLLVGVGFYEGAGLAVVDVTTGAVTSLANPAGARGMWSDGGYVLTWSWAYGYELPGMYLLNPAAPEEAPVQLLDDSFPVMDVIKAADGRWIVLYNATGLRGPEYVRALASRTLAGPFEPLGDGGGFVELPRLAPSSEGVPAADGAPVIAAGLRHLTYDEVGRASGELVIVDVTAGSTMRIRTGGPVWMVQWVDR